RDVHDLRLRLARRASVDPASHRRQRHRHARGRARGFAALGRWGKAVGQDSAHLSSRVATMRPSLRFLALAVVGWAGVRAAMLGALPGAEIFSIDKSEAKSPPPIVPTEFPPIEPIAPAGADAAAANYLPAGYAPMAPEGGG